MPSIQLSGVAPADAVDENGNPLNPQDQFGLPLYPAPTSQQLRSPNPINWPTRAPGQAPIFSNTVGSFVGPPTDPNTPNLWRGGNAVYNAGVNAYNTYGPELADAYRRFGGDVGKAYSWLFGHTGKPAQPDMSNPAMFGGDVGGVSPSDLPTPGLTLNTPPAQAAPAPGAQQGPPIPPRFMNTTNIGPQTYGSAATPAPAAAPNANVGSRSTDVPLPPPRPKNLGRGGGGGGSASGNRIPPQSVNLGYGAPNVGHYVPTTGIGRGPGTYVPSNDLGSQIHNLGVRIGQGLNNAFGVNQPVGQPAGALGGSQPAVTPLGQPRLGNSILGSPTPWAAAAGGVPQPNAPNDYGYINDAMFNAPRSYVRKVNPNDQAYSP